MPASEIDTKVRISALERDLGALMRASLAGDAEAYRRLLNDMSDHLRRYFVKRLGRDGAGEAEDLVQETLMAVHSRRATYETDRPFTVWMHAVARYKLIDHLRQRKLRVTVAVEDIDQLFAPDESEAAAARMDVDRLLEGIPAAQQSLIRQVKIEGHSIEDVAAKAGMSESAVKVSIHRGVKALAMRFRGREP